MHSTMCLLGCILGVLRSVTLLLKAATKLFNAATAFAKVIERILKKFKK
ncbi:MAG TPA: hypothetical protein H9820_03975 [Candidatus Companilactobacillus pullicola]|uniref:Uncharacterized protein n=1 Tax=Candidatus Companilactobacillus pullicola TaxID=2838523 RepID=A0A9D1ZM08_9LACO|nr:hypothetical protein [Candidatus Companilactobacillus pullicola]